MLERVPIRHRELRRSLGSRWSGRSERDVGGDAEEEVTVEVGAERG